MQGDVRAATHLQEDVCQGRVMLPTLRFPQDSITLPLHQGLFGAGKGLGAPGGPAYSLLRAGGGTRSECTPFSQHTGQGSDSELLSLICGSAGKRQLQGSPTWGSAYHRLQFIAGEQ